MTREQVFTTEEVIAAIRTGHTALGAAHILSCDPSTVRNYAKRYPTVARALKQERISMRDLGEMSMRGAIARGEGWAVMGVFKTFDENGEFIPPNQVNLEHSGKDGRPIIIRVVYEDKSSAG